MKNSYDIVCGVISGRIDEHGELQIVEIFGTASKLKEDIFITAGHCLKAIEGQEIKALIFRYTDENIFRIEKIQDSEIFEGEDIGLIKCPIPKIEILQWTARKIPMLHEVHTSGFPYGLNRNQRSIVVRAFKGYISCAPNKCDFLANEPGIYELNFPCPRGLSGAPLFNSSNEVIGIMIANSITEMVVYSERENDLAQGIVTVFEKTEAMHVGIAVRSQDILNLSSKLLGSKIHEYLEIN